MELFRRTRSQTRILRELQALRSFPSFVQHYFEPFIKAGKESNKFEWSSVDQFYNDFQDRLTNCHSLKIFCDFVLELFLAFNCDNERLMTRIMFAYWDFFLPKYDDAFSCQDCKESKCLKQSHFLDSRPLLREVNELDEGFYHLFRFTNKIFHSYQMCIKFRSEYTFLQFMLKYGISYFPDHIEGVDERFTELRWNYYEWKDMEIRSDYDDKTYLYKFRKNLLNPSWRRLLLIIEIVENVFKRDDNKSISAECFRLYSLSISEPAITVKEVEDFLDLAFADDRPFRIEALSNFRIVFADIPILTSPRSLKQLCRVKIRDILPRSRPHLPSAVAELDLLPYYLKNYLLFMCD